MRVLVTAVRVADGMMIVVLVVVMIPVGVLIWITVASARMSRYESGVHEPPIKTARDIAHALGVPLGYLYCDDDRLAEIILAASELPAADQEQLLKSLKERLDDLRPG